MKICTFTDGRCERCGTVRQPPYPRRNCRPGIGDRVEAGQGVIWTKVEKAPSGPGTELSRLLKRIGIEPTPTCACRAKAAEMDRWGPDECEKAERIKEVVAVMRQEAKARGLPFINAAGRLLVRRAIRNARRAASSDSTPNPDATDHW